jgi:hypothetical protein
MNQLVPYIRAADGAIQRISDGIYVGSSEFLEPYVYKQTLVGWPEPRVFWAKETGPSLGIAPLLSPPPD